MLCLALRSSPQQVYERALQQFTVGEISEAFAAARGLALPSQLRKMMRAQGRNLHGEFVRLLPEAPRPIGVQRWSTRRIALSSSSSWRSSPPSRWPGRSPLQRQSRRRPPSPAGPGPAPRSRSSGSKHNLCRRRPASLRSGVPRRHRRRAGCPRWRVGDRTQPRQPRHQPQHRRPAPGSRRGRRGDGPPHCIVRRPVRERKRSRRASGASRPKVRQHTPSGRRVPRRLCHLPARARRWPVGPAPGPGPACGYLRTRDDVREALRRYSNGRLQLDPDEDSIQVNSS